MLSFRSNLWAFTTIKGSDLLDYLVDPGVFEYREGFVHLLAGPGLGIEIDEAKVREAAKSGHRWRNPIWRTEDGAVAEMVKFFRRVFSCAAG